MLVVKGSPRVVAATNSEQAMSAVPSDSIAMHFAIGAFWALVGAVVSRGLTLASSVLAGRLLGTKGFGEVGMIQGTQGLFGIVAGAGLGLAATKFVAESRSIDPARTGRYTLPGRPRPTGSEISIQRSRRFLSTNDATNWTVPGPSRRFAGSFPEEKI